MYNRRMYQVNGHHGQKETPMDDLPCNAYMVEVWS
jgi:hypothetical protein